VPENKIFRAEGAEDRLDKFLAGKLRPLTRTYVQKLIAEGCVEVNGRPAKTSRRRLEAGDEASVLLPEFSALPSSAAGSVPVLFEDGEIIVVDKPAGVVVHPAGPHQSDTLVQRLWPKLAAGWGEALRGTSLHTARPGVVHRLDKGTSGVLVIAKTPGAAERLSRQFAERRVEKTYLALVRGSPKADSGVVRSTVGRDRRRPSRMSVTDPGRPAILEFKVLGRFPDDSLLEVRPRTGRTHQIRVQLASVGHPVLGDSTYEGPPGDRTFLHAFRLAFDHPRTGRRMVVTAPLPADMREALISRKFDAYSLDKLK
jgi:23S rRNA pseudouridine1911/1915/1917 synthase